MLSLLQPTTGERTSAGVLERVYSVNETLDPVIYQPVQHWKGRLQLKEYLEIMSKHFERNHIDWFATFGSLLAPVRNGIMMLPWDDDIDLAIPMAMRYRMSEGLKEATDVTHAWCTMEQKRENLCNIWELTDDGIYLLWKFWGIPWKVYNTRRLFKGFHLTFIDIYEYVHSTKTIYIPNRILKHGQVRVWSIPLEHIYPIGSMSVAFSGEVERDPSLGESVTVNLPHNPSAVIELTYGQDAMELCKTSFNHNDREFIKSTFPCTLLPEQFYQPEKVIYHIEEQDMIGLP